jgi:hypothetical protein
MTKLTRRSFLKQTSVGAATLSLLPAIPALAAISDLPRAAERELQTTLSGPMVAHVSNLGADEITLFVGAREIVFRDPVVVARLINAAR